MGESGRGAGFLPSPVRRLGGISRQTSGPPRRYFAAGSRRQIVAQNGSQRFTPVIVRSCGGAHSSRTSARNEDGKPEESGRATEPDQPESVETPDAGVPEPAADT